MADGGTVSSVDRTHPCADRPFEPHLAAAWCGGAIAGSPVRHTTRPHIRPAHDPASRRVAVLGRAVHDLEINRFASVTSRCAPLLASDPNDTEALLLSGLAAGARGHEDHAARLLQRAARDRRNAAHPFRDLALLLCRIGQQAQVEPQFQALYRISQDDVSLLYAYAEFLYDHGQCEAAVPVLSEAQRLQPDGMPARNLLAMAYASLGLTEAAIAQLRDATGRDPSRAGTWANLGLLLKDDGRFEEALAAYDIALSLTPDDAQIRVNRVVALLRAGRWAEAWPDYEWRLRLAEHAVRRPRLLPAMSRLPDLSGRTVLVVHEDGFGDTLHFASYLPLLASRGARVIVSVPAPLTRIMRSVPGVAAVVSCDDPLPAYHFYCPFFSLPRAFETTPDSIPASLPWLKADPELVAGWNARMPAGKVRVGLVWAGQARPMLPGFATLDGRRSLALTTLAPLASVRGASFISLQHGPEAAQAAVPSPGMTLFDPMPGAMDFADTAAIIENLDLVVSVDTSVVHLAGGMGKPVFLLDRYDHCWRWLSGREDSPWYPGLRIFRQTRIGDWAPVLQQATAALAEFVTSQSRL
jgi:tetratricopeptide (TPR) repeat protein